MTVTLVATQLVKATLAQPGRHSNLVTAAFLVALTVSVAHLHVKDINAHVVMCQLQTIWLAMAGTTTLAVQALALAISVELATPLWLAMVNLMAMVMKPVATPLVKAFSAQVALLH